MKQNYVRPFSKIISITQTPVLCASGSFAATEEQKKYGCPIKDAVDCPDYDKQVNEWVTSVEYLAKNRINQPFYTLSDKSYCPHKGTCPIYREYDNQKMR